MTDTTLREQIARNINTWPKRLGWSAAALFIVVLILFVLARVLLISSVENYELGYKFNRLNGQITKLERTGWFVNLPFVVSVKTVDLRPMQVCLNANRRVLNCKLVQFNASFFEDFLRVEGWWYYWWANRISYNLGHKEEYRGMRDILRGYSFSRQHYPFITVLAEFEGSE